MAALNPDIVRQQIANLILQNPELQDDEVLRADMIEAETDAHDFLRMIERGRQEAASLIEAIEANVADLVQRKDRFARREKNLRALAMKIMDAADLKKVELPEATLSIRAGTRKLLGDADPATLSPDYVRTKVEIDRPKIKDALKAGVVVPGFELSNAEPTLSVRVK